MSSTSVVAAAGPFRQHPQEACHRRLQLRWWPLSDLTASTPRGAAIDIFNFGGGRYRTLPPAPRRGPAINVFNFVDIFTLMVGPPGPSSVAPHGSRTGTGGGRCRTMPAAPPGPRRKRHELWWWPLLDLTASTPQGAHHRRLQHRWWPLSDQAGSTP
jgi:hypothetical protein